MARLKDIYVVTSSSDRQVKIGIASDPRKRLEGLQTGAHGRLLLAYVAEVNGDARTLERHVHQALHWCRLTGEWFNIPARAAISSILTSADTLNYALTDKNGVHLPTEGQIGGRRLRILTALTAAALKKPGRHADGGNLYLKITKTACGNISKSWTFLYCIAGKQREAGFGAFPTVTLAEARNRAAEYRVILDRGDDPLEVKKEVEKAESLRQWIAEMKEQVLEQKARASIAARASRST